MTLSDIAYSRLASQQIAGTGFETVKDLVGWMCAMQAQDFAWWSGLSAADSGNALEMVKPELVTEMAGNKAYWLNGSNHGKVENNSSVFLLPAYDEFLISYRDRGASLSPEIGKKTVSDNGIFRPVVVINGQVKGLWKKTTTNAKVLVEVNLFQQPGKKVKNIIEEKALIFGSFLKKTTEVVITTLNNISKQ
ncbi:MAG TPA: crosslink repair DNA glycosylase YcaQ family protein [Bacteroidales bacterium]|nr:crosslink repair DNA glycosylase YcaQ family protein [Bacteroidales bacterium]